MLLPEAAAAEGRFVPISVREYRFSIIIPVSRTAASAEEAVTACRRAMQADDELILVVDGAWQGEPTQHPSASRTILSKTQVGAAAARNLGSQQASGDFLVFVDSDVLIPPDALDRLEQRLAGDKLDAVFGSYCDEPSDRLISSRFRNLLHHVTHQRSAGPIRSFWTGFGAVRRQLFMQLGGLDARYRCSIEDVEFGQRMADAGARIALDPSLQVTHTKRWPLAKMIRSDIQDRALPWSHLILDRHELPDALNTSWRDRMAAALAGGLVACLGLTLVTGWMMLGALSCLVAFIAINRDFHALLWRKGGIPLLIGGIALHLLFYLYSAATFATLAARWWITSPERFAAWQSRAASS
ncbi:MAG: glycosyltransferase family 2 protein [Opitutales bacterium]